MFESTVHGAMGGGVLFILVSGRRAEQWGPLTSNRTNQAHVVHSRTMTDSHHSIQKNKDPLREKFILFEQSLLLKNWYGIWKLYHNSFLPYNAVSYLKCTSHRVSVRMYVCNWITKRLLNVFPPLSKKGRKDGGLRSIAFACARFTCTRGASNQCCYTLLRALFVFPREEGCRTKYTYYTNKKLTNKGISGYQTLDSRRAESNHRSNERTVQAHNETALHCHCSLLPVCLHTGKVSNWVLLARENAT